MGFTRQTYWNGLSFRSPGDHLNPGIEPRSPALQAVSCVAGGLSCCMCILYQLSHQGSPETLRVWSEWILTPFCAKILCVFHNDKSVKWKWKFWSLSCVWLCDPTDCSPPGSSVCGILQARIWEWVVISYSRESSRTTDRTRVSCVSCIAGRFFTIWATYTGLCLSNFLILFPIWIVLDYLFSCNLLKGNHYVKI